MDNLAHSLAGAVLAETGLKRLTPLATATLIVGANLPDIDALTVLLGGDESLWWRRGVTHGLAALTVWTLALTVLMLIVDRVRRRRRPEAVAADPRWVLALSAIGVWSHTALDWLNVYGVRWLMPFDGRWFYGDSLFIVDPWFWLLAGAAVVLARTSRPLGLVGWSVVGLATSGLVLTTPMVPWPVRLVWLTGVALILWARRVVGNPEAVRRIATVTTSLLVAYIALMVLGSWRARVVTAAWLDRQGVDYELLVANPLAGDSFSREVIVVRPAEYAFVRVSLLPSRVRHGGSPIRRGDTPDVKPVIQAALVAPEHRGLRNWLRLPAYVVTRSGGMWHVAVRDVRYAHLGRQGPGAATLQVADDAVRAAELRAHRW